MQNKDFLPEGVPIDVAVFNKLVVDNERLKLRVDALEKLYQDAQKEILTLQECMSTLINTELRMDCTTLKKKRYQTETVSHRGYVNDGNNRLFNEILQFNGHTKCEEVTKNGVRNHRQIEGYNRERRTSPNEYKPTQERRFNLHCKTDDKYTSREYVEHSCRSREYPSTRSHKTIDRGSENSSKRNDYTDKSTSRRRADENQKSSILEKSQQIDFKYSKERHIHETSTSKPCDKHDADERSDNAIRSRDRIRNFSHERRASPNRRKSCSSEPRNLYCKSDNDYAVSEYAGYRDRSSERSSRRRCENHNVDRNERSSVAEGGQQQNFKHSEERNRITPRPTFDERDRKSGSFERSSRLDRCSNRQFRDKSERVTASSNILHSRKPAESPLPRGRNPVTTESFQSQSIAKKPQPRSDDPTKNINNSKRSGSEKTIRDSETKKKRQCFQNDRISSLTQKETVDCAMEDLVFTQKRERSPNETVELDVLSSSKITLWSDTGKVESTIGSDYLNKIYSTPIKFINDFANRKILSPLHHTPNRPMDDFQEQKSVEIIPVPLLLDVTTPNKGNESTSDTKMKPALSEGAGSTICENKDQTRVTLRDSVEILTVIKTDDAEHGVFKRRRRKL